MLYKVLLCILLSWSSCIVQSRYVADLRGVGRCPGRQEKVPGDDPFKIECKPALATYCTDPETRPPGYVDGTGKICTACTCDQANHRCRGESSTTPEYFACTNVAENNAIIRYRERPYTVVRRDGEISVCKATPCVECFKGDTFGRYCAQPTTCQFATGYCYGIVKNPSGARGTCSGVGGDGFCDLCKENWFGKNCESRATCNLDNGYCDEGECFGPNASGTCSRCKTGYYGPNCENEVTCDTKNGDCKEGDCYGVTGSGHCTTCEAGFEGADCTCQIDASDSDTCCSVVSSSAPEPPPNQSCSCRPGFNGRRCSRFLRDQDVEADGSPNMIEFCSKDITVGKTFACLPKSDDNTALQSEMVVCTAANIGFGKTTNIIQNGAMLEQAINYLRDIVSCHEDPEYFVPEVALAVFQVSNFVHKVHDPRHRSDYQQSGDSSTVDYQALSLALSRIQAKAGFLYSNHAQLGESLVVEPLNPYRVDGVLDLERLARFREVNQYATETDVCYHAPCPCGTFPIVYQNGERDCRLIQGGPYEELELYAVYARCGTISPTLAAQKSFLPRDVFLSRSMYCLRTLESKFESPSNGIGPGSGHDVLLAYQLLRRAMELRAKVTEENSRLDGLYLQLDRLIELYKVKHSLGQPSEPVPLTVPPYPAVWYNEQISERIDQLQFTMAAMQRDRIASQMTEAIASTRESILGALGTLNSNIEAGLKTISDEMRRGFYETHREIQKNAEQFYDVAQSEFELLETEFLDVVARVLYGKRDLEYAVARYTAVSERLSDAVKNLVKALENAEIAQSKYEEAKANANSVLQIIGSILSIGSMFSPLGGIGALGVSSLLSQSPTRRRLSSIRQGSDRDTVAQKLLEEMPEMVEANGKIATYIAINMYLDELELESNAAVRKIATDYEIDDLRTTEKQQQLEKTTKHLQSIQTELYIKNWRRMDVGVTGTGSELNFPLIRPQIRRRLDHDGESNVDEILGTRDLKAPASSKTTACVRPTLRRSESSLTLSTPKLLTMQQKVGKYVRTHGKWVHGKLSLAAPVFAPIALSASLTSLAIAVEGRKEKGEEGLVTGAIKADGYEQNPRCLKDIPSVLCVTCKSAMHVACIGRKLKDDAANNEIQIPSPISNSTYVPACDLPQKHRDVLVEVNAERRNDQKIEISYEEFCVGIGVEDELPFFDQSYQPVGNLRLLGEIDQVNAMFDAVDHANDNSEKNLEKHSSETSPESFSVIEGSRLLSNWKTPSCGCDVCTNTKGVPFKSGSKYAVGGMAVKAMLTFMSVGALTSLFWDNSKNYLEERKEIAKVYKAEMERTEAALLDLQSVLATPMNAMQGLHHELHQLITGRSHAEDESNFDDGSVTSKHDSAALWESSYHTVMDMIEYDLFLCPRTAPTPDELYSRRLETKQRQLRSGTANEEDDPESLLALLKSRAVATAPHRKLSRNQHSLENKQEALTEAEAVLQKANEELRGSIQERDVSCGKFRTSFKNVTIWAKSMHQGMIDLVGIRRKMTHVEEKKAIFQNRIQSAADSLDEAIRRTTETQSSPLQQLSLDKRYQKIVESNKAVQESLMEEELVDILDITQEQLGSFCAAHAWVNPSDMDVLKETCNIGELSGNPINDMNSMLIRLNQVKDLMEKSWFDLVYSKQQIQSNQVIDVTEMIDLDELKKSNFNEPIDFSLKGPLGGVSLREYSNPLSSFHRGGPYFCKVDNLGLTSVGLVFLDVNGTVLTSKDSGSLDSGSDVISMDITLSGPFIKTLDDKEYVYDLTPFKDIPFVYEGPRTGGKCGVGNEEGLFQGQLCPVGEQVFSHMRPSPYAHWTVNIIDGHKHLRNAAKVLVVASFTGISNSKMPCRPKFEAQKVPEIKTDVPQSILVPVLATAICAALFTGLVLVNKYTPRSTRGGTDKPEEIVGNGGELVSENPKFDDEA